MDAVCPTINSTRLEKGASFADENQGRAMADYIPPQLMVLLSILSIQVGAATAKSLFDFVGAPGVVLMRTGFAAMVLWIAARPKVGQYTRRQWGYAAALGVVTAAMNLSFYAALTCLPLGIAVTIEFLGPLGVAFFGSRKPVDFIWPVLALAGILLLTPLGQVGRLDTAGMIYAFGAAAGWAGYILLTARTSAIFPGTTGLALAMTFGALAILPVGLVESGAALLNGSLLFKGFLVAMLSTAAPFSLEFLALKRIKPRMFGVLVSSEPAVAALVGLVLLHECLSPQSWTALGLVSMATVGVTLTGKRG